MIDITLPHKEEYAKKGIILTVVPKTPKSYCVVKLRGIKTWTTYIHDSGYFTS